MNKLKIYIYKKQLYNLYYNKKLSIYKIAKKFKCSATTISKRLKKFNIKAKSVSEYMIGNKHCKSGKEHHNWKEEKHKIYYCNEKNCNNKITYYSWKKGSGRCRSCANRFKEPSKGMLGKKHSKETLDKLRNCDCKHHIYLKENSNKKIILNKKKHMVLHFKAYEYLYEKYGKKGINNYIEWFDKKYKLKSK